MTPEPACACGGCATADLPVTPFEALRVSYGMLLGEDDFRVLMGSPRGKQMLHSAWLHGPGVVWGYDVRPQGLYRIEVSSGLAVDGEGRELACDVRQCVDLPDWLSVNDHPATQDGCERRTVVARVVAEHSCYPTRPVPTLADTCDVTRRHDDDSRVVETVTVRLVPGAGPSPRPVYHRVRVLLGLDEVGEDDQPGEQARAARERISRAPAEQRARALLAEFRRQAALDVAQVRPPRDPAGAGLLLFPVAEEDAAVVLAAVEIDVRDADGCTTVEDVRIDTSARTAVLPASLAQELVCAVGACLPTDPEPGPDGPRVFADRLSWSRDGHTLHLPVSAALHPATVRRGLTVNRLTDEGWDDVDLGAVRWDGHRTAIALDFARRPGEGLLRVVVRGTGPRPVYGRDPAVPLAGLWGGPAVRGDEGHDAVVTLTIGPSGEASSEPRHEHAEKGDAR